MSATCICGEPVPWPDLVAAAAEQHDAEIVFGVPAFGVSDDTFHAAVRLPHRDHHVDLGFRLRAFGGPMGLVAAARRELPEFVDQLAEWLRWLHLNPDAAGHRNAHRPVGPWAVVRARRGRELEVRCGPLTRLRPLLHDRATPAEELNTDLAEWLDEIEAHLVAMNAPPDWRPAEAIPEDDYAGGRS